MPDLSTFLESLLATVPGLTREHADALAAEGLLESRHFTGVTAADVKAACGIRLALAGEVKAAADAARTAADDRHAVTAALVSHVAALASSDPAIRNAAVIMVSGRRPQ